MQRPENAGFGLLHHEVMMGFRSSFSQSAAIRCAQTIRFFDFAKIWMVSQSNRQTKIKMLWNCLALQRYCRCSRFTKQFPLNKIDKSQSSFCAAGEEVVDYAYSTPMQKNVKCANFETNLHVFHNLFVFLQACP